MIFDNSTIIALYDHVTGMGNGHAVGDYYFTEIFRSTGPIDEVIMQKTYRDIFHTEPAALLHESLLIGPFETEKSLSEYAYKLLEAIQIERVLIVSLTDYNESLRASDSKNEFFKNLFEKGNLIENIDKKGRKWGIWDKLVN